MSDYVIAPPVPAALPVRGSAQMFPVRRIFCVGRNYAEHAIEMGSDPTREPPFYFTKPADAVVVREANMPYPPATSSLPRMASVDSPTDSVPTRNAATNASAPMLIGNTVAIAKITTSAMMETISGDMVPPAASRPR